MSQETTTSGNTSDTVTDPWSRVVNLTCELTVELSVKNFRVRDLANLKTGALIDSHWALGRHVPVFANGLLLAWGQFEAVGRTLAVRLADLA